MMNDKFYPILFQFDTNQYCTLKNGPIESYIYIYLSYIYISENTHTHTHNMQRRKRVEEEEEKRISLFPIENHHISIC